MSYEEFFHLKDAPFRLTPDPDYFFPSAVHKEALDTMVFSINAGEGFVLITGNPGSGKTLLVRTLLRQLGDKVNLALVLNPTLSPRELLRVILDDLHVFNMDEIEQLSKEKLLRLFRDNLLENAARGIKTIIIIDEAQNLPKDTLEELRMLSNLESDKEKLLQIILVGQLELEELLKHDDMKQLAQRISIRYRLQPLSADETGGYVRHRLEVAGGNMSVSFMPRVMNRIHSLSKGIPRRINIICERALMAAYVDGEKSVSKKHLVRAIKSIEGHEDRISTTPGWLWPTLGGTAVVAAALWVALQYNSGNLGKNVVQTQPATQVDRESDQQSQVDSQQQSAETSPIKESDIKANARVLPEPESSPAVQEQVGSQQTSVGSEQQVPSNSKLSANKTADDWHKIQKSELTTESATSPQDQVSSTPHSSSLTPPTQTVEQPVLRQPPGELVQYLDEKAGPSLLPVNEFYLAVDRESNLAQLWQGGPSGPVVRHQFQLDWRIMEGLYILGNDASRGAFIFNPILFQWGGYNLLSAAALWRQVSTYVSDTVVPVIVYSGDKHNNEFLAADVPAIRESINSWSQSWQERNIAKLMSFYGNTFASYTIDENQPQVYSRAQLADIRARILVTSSYISLKTSTPVCLIDPLNPDMAIAVFRQEYVSNIYQDKGTKILYLRREGSYPERPWKIIAKFFLPEE